MYIMSPLEKSTHIWILNYQVNHSLKNATIVSFYSVEILLLSRKVLVFDNSVSVQNVKQSFAKKDKFLIPQAGRNKNGLLWVILDSLLYFFDSKPTNGYDSQASMQQKATLE